MLLILRILINNNIIILIVVVFGSYRSVSVPNTSRQQNDANLRADEIGLLKTLESETTHESTYALQPTAVFHGLRPRHAQILTMSNHPICEQYTPTLVG
jgi:hypothetical protein